MPMFRSEKYYAGVILQFLSIVLLGIYLYVSYPSNPDNLIWVGGAIALFFIGWARRLSGSLAASLIAVAVYGAFVGYRSWFGESPYEVGWNELAWLVIFPLSALFGALNRKSSGSDLEAEAFFLDLQNNREQQAAPCLVDEQMGFLSANAFMYKVEEEVLVALRERRSFRMLLVQIEQFREFRLLFGAEQAQSILDAVAEMMSEFVTATKSQVGGPLLAGLLSSADPSAVTTAKETMSGKFYELLLARPRRESTVKLSLRFGVSECPTDGLEAKALLEKAKSDLAWSGIDMPERT